MIKTTHPRQDQEEEKEEEEEKEQGEVEAVVQAEEQISKSRQTAQRHQHQHVLRAVKTLMMMMDGLIGAQKIHGARAGMMMMHGPGTSSPGGKVKFQQMTSRQNQPTAKQRMSQSHPKKPRKGKSKVVRFRRPRMIERLKARLQRR